MFLGQGEKEKLSQSVKVFRLVKVSSHLSMVLIHTISYIKKLIIHRKVQQFLCVTLDVHYGRLQYDHPSDT